MKFPEIFEFVRMLFSTELPDNLKALFRPVGRRKKMLELDDDVSISSSHDGSGLWSNCREFAFLIWFF